MAATILTALTTLALCSLTVLADEGPGRIYTRPDPADAARISGSVTGARLTHAIAVERDRVRVYQATLTDDGATFRFDHLPVGRYDLVLVTRDHRVFEGLELGAPPALDATRAANLAAGVAKADTFFNRHQRHRAGASEERALVFVERIRDNPTVKHSGEALNAHIRRLEIIEFHPAADDWQMVRTRHLFREQIPRFPDTPFLTHHHLPALTNIRAAAKPRVLPALHLPAT
ncbi:MAG: hypothetical protein MUF04_07430 [Akkermansiaceae bacterium]|nr:hypothetical protein [Akkermansiaceae bacterium]